MAYSLATGKEAEMAPPPPAALTIDEYVTIFNTVVHENPLRSIIMPKHRTGPKQKPPAAVQEKRAKKATLLQGRLTLQEQQSNLTMAISNALLLEKVRMKWATTPASEDRIDERLLQLGVIHH